VAYDKRVTGEGKSGESVIGGGLAQRALNAAMQDAVTRVFGGPAFVDALNGR